MTEYAKKQLVALLLFICCIAGAWLLFITPTTKSKQLDSFAQIDSLLQQTFVNFNISQRQISRDISQVDSSFKRISYHVAVPPKLSKTQLHAALKKIFAPYGIGLPAQVSFPDRAMRIHFYTQNTILRTLALVTDGDLKMKQSRGSLLAVFKGQPPSYQLQTLKSWGEPIPIAIILQPPLQRPDWWEALTESYGPVFIWPQTEEGQNLLAANRQQVWQLLEPLQQTLSEATLLSFYEDQHAGQAWPAETSFNFIDVNDAYILNAQTGQKGFKQTFETYVQQARAGASPIGIIMANEETLRWTQQQLGLYSHGGFTLVKPHRQTFD